MDYDAPLLVGGGIGIPPMLFLAKKYKEAGKRPRIVCGYRDRKSMYLYEELCEITDVYAATDDGSYAMQGTVVDVLRGRNLPGDVILACGPKGMLAGIKDLAAERGIKAFVSLEERMACGIGACLACVCKTTEEDAHSHVHLARVCKDGPVFDADDVIL